MSKIALARPTRGCSPASMLTRLVAVAAIGFAAAASAAPSGPPIRIGSSLSLTGPLAQTAMLHKIAGEIYVDNLNKGNGLLGRPVEWVVYDDQSKPEITRTLYDKLITVDKVDLIVGPYGTGTILAAMAVAERYGKLLPHHSFGIPKLAKYERHIPIGAMGFEPESVYINQLLDAIAASGASPKTIAIVSSKFPSVQFVANGMRDVLKKRGMTEVLYLEYEFGARDFGPIAARIRDAKPDFLWVGAIGLDGNLLLEALKKIEYTPKNHFYLYPAPGPLVASPDAKNAFSVTTFEAHPPFTERAGAAAFVKEFNERALKANLPYPVVELQAASSFSMFQVLEAAITATKSLDDKVLADWLKKNKIETINGTYHFDGQHNYGPALFRLKQVQNGKWVVVWPKEFAAPGAKPIVQ